MRMPDEKETTRFATRAVHSGTQHIGDAVNTPIFQSSTYKLTDERYAGWAAGAQHTLLYARLSTVNSDAVAQKLAAMEHGEDAETFSSGMGAISTTLLARQQGFDFHAFRFRRQIGQRRLALSDDIRIALGFAKFDKINMLIHLVFK